jgi:hypothetical protein
MPGHVQGLYGWLGSSLSITSSQQRDVSQRGSSRSPRPAHQQRAGTSAARVTTGAILGSSARSASGPASDSHCLSLSLPDTPSVPVARIPTTEAAGFEASCPFEEVRTFPVGYRRVASAFCQIQKPRTHAPVALKGRTFISTRRVPVCGSRIAPAGQEP